MSSLFRKMDTRRLHNSDMKELVRILRNSSHSTPNHDPAEQDKDIETKIKQLPLRLRSLPLSARGSLCRTHKGLDSHLMDHIWSWIKFELEVGIGRFLYPIIMSGLLSKLDEYRARQLEPVIRMFNSEYTLARSAPFGVEPIDAGDKWKYQKNGCPTCMLARIGSDENALFALFAGMYGHHRSRSGGRKGVDKIRSKRLRFVRYWMRTYADGEQKTFDSYDLGVKLKALRHDAKAALRRAGQPTRNTRDSLDEQLVTARHCLDNDQAAAVDISDPYNPKDWTTNDPKSGPMPPLTSTPPPAVDHRHNKPLPKPPQPRIHIQPPTPYSSHAPNADPLLPHPLQVRAHTSHDSVLDATIPPPRPKPNIPIQHPTPHPHPLHFLHPARRDSLVDPPRPASITSTPSSRLTMATSIVTSIASYNAPGTRTTLRPRYDPFDTSEERAAKYCKLLYMSVGGGADLYTVRGIREGSEGEEEEGVVGFGKMVLPRPGRGSMYHAFGTAWDGSEWDEVDESVVDGEDEENGEEDDDEE